MDRLTRESGAGTSGEEAAASLRWLALFLIPFCVLAVVHWGWSPRASAGDYAQYLLHTRALVEGRAYGDIGYIYHPAAGLIGPPALPPGLPLTLAPIVAIGGVHSPLVRLLMLASVVAFATLVTWRLAREVQPWQAAFGAACAAYALEVTLATVAPLSDPGFAALIWGTIVAVDREGSWTWRRVVLVTALGFAAMAYRTAGVALIPGLLLYALVQRRRFGVLPFTPAALWIAAGLVALAAGFVNIPFGERMARSIADVSEHIDTFVDQYRLAPLYAWLYPFENNRANDLYHLVAAVPTLVGMAHLLWHARRSFLVAMTAAYCLLLLVAPVAEPRYAWPLYPLVGTSLAYGATRIMQRVARRWTPRTVALAAGAPLAFVLLVALAKDARRPMPASFVRHPDAIALFGWLAQHRENAPADAPLRIAFFNPRIVTLETRVPAMGIVPRTPPGIVTALRQSRVTHLIWQGVAMGGGDTAVRLPCVQRVANRLPDLYPDFFTVEYRNPTFRVYRFHPAATFSDSAGEPISWSAC
ncbi:MAG: hypothetical protein ACT4P6_13205 [Gemmatimonadaceae bacterium]